MSLPEPLAQLVTEFRRLPGIGEKSAERIVFHLLDADPEAVRSFGAALATLHEKIRRCRLCFNFAAADSCRLCDDPARSHRAICVVGAAADIAAVERAGVFDGRYFVLGNPGRGGPPEESRLAPLLGRIRAGGVEEVVVATNPTHEGEGAAAWLARILKPEGVRITRIGIGVPIGSELVHADTSTMSEAFSHRSPL